MILDALGSDHFKAVFDFANFVQCGEDPVECWKLLHDQVVYIHIKDAVASDKENVLCGTGEGKIKEILAEIPGARGCGQHHPGKQGHGRCGRLRDAVSCSERDIKRYRALGGKESFYG